MKKIPDTKNPQTMTRKQLKRLWKHTDRFQEAITEWKRRNGGSSRGL